MIQPSNVEKINPNKYVQCFVILYTPIVSSLMSDGQPSVHLLVLHGRTTTKKRSCETYEEETRVFFTSICTISAKNEKTILLNMYCALTTFLKSSHEKIFFLTEQVNICTASEKRRLHEIFSS